MKNSIDKIVIKGAKENNLKNVSLELPKNKLIVFTGVSGSGKSSLAFDTLYAEGQRRYVESLSSYARQFLGLMEKPDVESITGLSPAISIDQKTSGSNPRSTVGTVTEIYGYLRLLFGHISTPHCPNCGKLVHPQSIEQIVESVKKIIKKEEGNFEVLAPIIKNRKGEYSALFEKYLQEGFVRILVDGNTYMLDDIENLKLDQNKKHTIDLIIDRLSSSLLKEDIKSFSRRLTDAIELSTNISEGEVKIKTEKEEHFFSENSTCFDCNLSYPKTKPSSFSFNSPEGACPNCSGLGTINQINIEKLYNPNLTILEGGIFPWGNRTTTNSWTSKILLSVAEEHGFDLRTKIGKYPKDIFNLIFFGDGAKESYKIKYTNRFGRERIYDTQYEGVVNEILRRYKETSSPYVRSETEKYMEEKECPVCNGNRLKPYSLSATINDKNIIEISDMPIKELVSFLNNLSLKGNNLEISKPILKEINSRLQFLENVGLSYLTLSRKANTLSGGESQRIRLASQIGTGLSGVLYVLDEPSIGLHPKDVSKLINSLKNLRETGNTVIVVEHDEATMESADWIVDIGPKAGEYGGEILSTGTIKDIKQTDSLTAKYLNKSLVVGENLKKKNPDDTSKSIKLKGVKTHNLKNLNLEIPLGKLVCITGVSGSGKSSLINDTLYPVLMNRIMRSKMTEGSYDSIEGLDTVTKVIGIDQSPIGKTPRSNPATYTDLFIDIRNLYTQTPEARSRGYKSGRFSFNVKGGRCEKCKGDGQIKVEMQFLPDMYITCDECEGKRYNKEVLQVAYKDKNIAEVLNMRVDEAYKFFSNQPRLRRILSILKEVGLGYIKLGQSALKLSGGESQRIKLAKELSRQTRGHTLYILDEPTTGLHFYDTDKLLTLLQELVNKGNSVIIIEHNPDVIRHADWIIDLGPEGGEFGGQIVFEGTVEDIKKDKSNSTGKYL